jgi:hypothetical protein
MQALRSFCQADIHTDTKAVSLCVNYPQDRKILQRIFDRIDSKHDNKIDKEELEQTLIALGYEPVKVTIVRLPCKGIAQKLT